MVVVSTNKAVVSMEHSVIDVALLWIDFGLGLVTLAAPQPIVGSSL